MKVICFNPDPGNTRGEVESTGSLALRYHQQSLVLVTTSAQDTRARVLLRHFFADSDCVVTAPISLATDPIRSPTDGKRWSSPSGAPGLLG